MPMPKPVSVADALEEGAGGTPPVPRKKAPAKKAPPSVPKKAAVTHPKSTPATTARSESEAVMADSIHNINPNDVATAVATAIALAQQAARDKEQAEAEARNSAIANAVLQALGSGTPATPVVQPVAAAGDTAVIPAVVNSFLPSDGAGRHDADGAKAVEKAGFVYLERTLPDGTVERTVHPVHEWNTGSHKILAGSKSTKSNKLSGLAALLKPKK